jgi:hypothetical protein
LEELVEAASGAYMEAKEEAHYRRFQRNGVVHGDASIDEKIFKRIAKALQALVDSKSTPPPNPTSSSSGGIKAVGAATCFDPRKPRTEQTFPLPAHVAEALTPKIVGLGPGTLTSHTISAIDIALAQAPFMSSLALGLLPTAIRQALINEVLASLHQKIDSSTKKPGESYTDFPTPLLPKFRVPIQLKNPGSADGGVFKEVSVVKFWGGGDT